MMFRDLSTPILLLKCISYDDACFFYREFSNEDVNRYLFDADPCSSEEEAQEWIGFDMEPEPRNQQRWIIVRKETGESIGTCGFHCWNRETGEVEIGYDLYPSYWRQGYMTEALTQIIDFAKAEMRVKKVNAHSAAAATVFSPGKPLMHPAAHSLPPKHQHRSRQSCLQALHPNNR